MFKMGAIGTAVGGGLGLVLAKAGFVIGTPFGPLGMGTGALLGFLIGSLIGAVGGYFGGEAIAKGLDKFGKWVAGLWTDITNIFKKVINDVWDWIKLLFVDPKTALTKLLKGIMGILIYIYIKD